MSLQMLSYSLDNIKYMEEKGKLFIFQYFIEFKKKVYRQKFQFWNALILYIQNFDIQNYTTRGVMYIQNCNV